MSMLWPCSSNGSEMASAIRRATRSASALLDLREENGELVAGQARQQRPLDRTFAEFGGDDDAQPVGDHDQQLVAAGMAKAVVDVLEPVEIDEQHRRHGLRRARSPSSLSASARKWSRLGSEVTGSYMPSAWAFSIDARTSANRLSTAVASLGICRGRCAASGWSDRPARPPAAGRQARSSARALSLLGRSEAM